MGLAIVSEIVRNSNGALHASNHPEGGAVMTLTRLNGEKNMNNKSSEITIVYIEDSDDVRFAQNKRSRWLVIVLFPVAMQNTVFPLFKVRPTLLY